MSTITNDEPIWRSYGRPRWKERSLLDDTAYDGHFPALRWLLAHGADASQTRYTYKILFTILSADVTKEEKIRLCKQAIDNGLNITKENVKQLVCNAVSEDDPERLKMLLHAWNNIPQESQNILEKTIKYITVLKLVEASALLEDKAPVKRDRLLQELSLLYRRSN